MQVKRKDVTTFVCLVTLTFAESISSDTAHIGSMVTSTDSISLSIADFENSKQIKLAQTYLCEGFAIINKSISPKGERSVHGNLL